MFLDSIDYIYKNQYSSQHKRIYECIYDAMNNLCENIILYDLSENDILLIDRIVQDIFKEHPELFYINFNALSFEAINRHTLELSWDLFFSKKEIIKYKKEILCRAKRIVAKIEKISTNPFVMSRLLYEDMNQCIQYNGIDKKDLLNQSIYSVFILGKSTCGGFACAYKYILNLCGIECAVVRGAVDNDFTTEDDYNPPFHLFNIIKIDGYYYWCDPAWGQIYDGYDNNKIVRYDWFAKDDETFLKTHHIDIWDNSNIIFPKCNESIECNDLSSSTAKEIRYCNDISYKIIFDEISSVFKNSNKGIDYTCYSRHSNNILTKQFVLKIDNDTPTISSNVIKILTKKISNTTNTVLDKLVNKVLDKNHKILVSYRIYYNDEENTLLFVINYKKYEAKNKTILSRIANKIRKTNITHEIYLKNTYDNLMLQS